MKVAYQLRRMSASEPATALLISGHQPEELLRLCADLALDPLPTIYAVADGFVVMLPAPSERLLAGAIRLRELAEHLLIPVNAELIPPLLPDELTALVKRRGLVFLPGSRVLEFDPEQVIGPSALLRMDRVSRGDWQPLPDPPALAETLTEMTLLTIDVTPEEILEQGGDGIGEEKPTPAGGSLPSQIAANTLFQLGKGLAWLGNAMNAAPLAGLGAKLLGGAMSLVPKLSEKLMGQQEAMLRELLRRFRMGDIEEALRRALPLGVEPGRGSGFAANAQLPTNNLFYSLLNLLGNSGRGPAGIWFSRDNTYYELLQEYGKQAIAATNRGDFRRAAFIYAKLLNDYLNAAKVLAQGGLHRDAAILYEKKLQNPVQAAREWEAAGDIDRALYLYRTMGDHGAAGDLLARVGEHDRAVEEYRLAAAKLLEAGPKFFEAGELMRVRAQRPDLAVEYYVKGWLHRPEGAHLPCALHLMNHLAETGETTAFLGMLSEAETFLLERDAGSSATFFTEMAWLAQTPTLKPIADEVHDRALLGIAKKMRQGGGAAVNWFSSPSVWPVPLTGDAQYALTEARRRPPPVQPKYQTVQAGRSIVTAVCQIPLSNQVFLGCENGEVLSFDPTTGEVHVLTRENGPIVSLVVDASKTFVVILSQMGLGKVCVRVVSRTVGYRALGYTYLDVMGSAFLAVPAVNSNPVFVVVCDDRQARLLRVPSLIVEGCEFVSDGEGPSAVVCASGNPNGPIRVWLLAIEQFQAELFVSFGQPSEPSTKFTTGRVLALPETSTLHQIPLHAVILDGGSIDVTCLDAQGHLVRATFFVEKNFVTIRADPPLGKYRYVAFAVVRADLLAGVHVNGVDWLTGDVKRSRQTKLALKNPVAALALPQSPELLIVESNGLLTRVSIGD